MNEVRGRDSPGAAFYELHHHTLSATVSKSKGFPKVTEQRFQESRLREKKFKNLRTKLYYLIGMVQLSLPLSHWTVTLGLNRMHYRKLRKK